MVDPQIQVNRPTRLVERIRFPEQISSIFKECTPRILVVADGSLNFSAAAFGLKSFVDTLKSSTIHGMTPIVETAHRGAAASDHPNFKFTATTFKISKYDVVLLFGIQTAPPLPAAEVEVISKFMQDGGGVFATGDHDELGKALCNEIPRVRSMRYWSHPDVPSAGGFDRLSTNDPGANNTFEFDDQSDIIPQKIYPKYYLPLSGIPSDSQPHALLQHPTKKVVEVLPDHPHEGECVNPRSLTTTFHLGGATVDEWPKNNLGLRVAPELVALSMSYGGGFPGKQPIAPRSFGAIGAYDGHRANVGRVSVDATWHHFININLTGAGSPGPGLDANPDAIDRVHTYFRNIPEWLMPRKRRLCLRWPLILQALELYPLPEILPTLKIEQKDLNVAMQIGTTVHQSLSRFMPAAAVDDLALDLIALHRTELADNLECTRRGHEKVGDRLRTDLTPTRSLIETSLGLAAQTIYRLMPPGSDFAASLREAGGMEGIEREVQKDLKAGLRQLSSMLREETHAVLSLFDAEGK
jgi:hypothetical protein